MTTAKLFKHYKPARMPEDENTFEWRILRALKTLRAVPDPDAKVLGQFRGSAVCWPDVVREEQEAYGYEAARARRFRPTPKDISRMLGDLAWLNGIGKQHFKILWLRSLDLPFSIIGLRLNKSDETARRWYREAIMEVTKAALQGEYEV